MDPLAGKYVFVSPYQVVNNSPIRLIDPDGREWVNGYDAEVASLNEQLLKNPNSKKLQRKLNKAIENQWIVNEKINSIKTNDISLYNYIENLTVKDVVTGEVINVKATITIDHFLNRDRNESASTRFNISSLMGV